MSETIARPLSEYHEDIGPVLWWKFPIEEPPYVGSPNDAGQPMRLSIDFFGGHEEMTVHIGGWPGYHTHWTPIDTPTSSNFVPGSFLRPRPGHAPTCPSSKGFMYCNCNRSART